MITAKNASLNFSIIKLSWIRPNGSPSPRKRRHHQFSPLFHIPNIPNIPNISILVLCQNSYWSHGPVEIVSFSHEKWWDLSIFAIPTFPTSPNIPFSHGFPMVFPHGCGRVFVLNRPKSTQILCTDGTPIGNLQLLQDCHQVLEALALSPCRGTLKQ